MVHTYVVLSLPMLFDTAILDGISDYCLVSPCTATFRIGC